MRLVSMNAERIFMSDDALLSRITTDPTIFGGKPTIRGHGLAVECLLGMLGTGRFSRDDPGSSQTTVGPVNS